MSTPFLTHHLLEHARVKHGFFTRQGGVSTGIYRSLNCGPGSADDADNVRTNRHRVIAALDGGELASLRQVHSPDVYVLEAALPAERPKADALVTRTPGMLLGILTADCGPVLFADPEARVIGAAHAGWKGAFSGVLENTVAAMETLGAQRARIRAVLGPCIHQPSYEVGPEFYARLADAAAANTAFFRPSPLHGEKWQFDLPGYVLAQLARTGIGGYASVARDTCAEHAFFFSYRRSTLRNEPDYGRQVSVIGLR